MGLHVIFNTYNVPQIGANAFIDPNIALCMWVRVQVHLCVHVWVHVRMCFCVCGGQRTLSVVSQVLSISLSFLFFFKTRSLTGLELTQVGYAGCSIGFTDPAESTSKVVRLQTCMIPSSWF